MALFKFRLPGQGEAAPEGRARTGAGATHVRKAQAGPAESVESLRQRARHRVIGAAVLVVAAVIGFPMLFDSQPRPVDVNVPIAIPDRDQVPPLHVTPAGGQERVAAQDSLAEHEEVVGNDPAPVATPVRSATSTAARSAVNADEQAARDKAEQDKAEQARAAKAEREAREQAAKDKAAKEKTAKEKAAKEKAAKEARDKAAKEKAKERAEKDKAERAEQDKAERAERAEKQAHDKAERDKREKAAKDKAERLAKEKAEKADKADKDKADTGRFVVQVGSFGEDSKAKEARSKLERAGIATYIQVIDTSEGKRTRVRVGPFGSRAEAEAAAKKVKALGLYSGIAEL
jgi:DedD protein